MRAVVFAVVVCLGVCAGAEARPAPVRVDMPLRGRTMALTMYTPEGSPKGTIIMGSGDVGWVGLAASRAQELSADGYLVAGVNIREYLSSFTTKNGHLEATDIQHDFAALADHLRRRGALVRPVILSGVSEGAGIVVAAAAATENHGWVDGVITMGLPRLSEMAWRWSDFTSWITKKDAAEPSADALAYLPQVSPVPLVMLQSRKDEYVPESDYQQMARVTNEPKKLVLIDASNHRFTDRLPELRHAYDDAIAWVRSNGMQR